MKRTLRIAAVLTLAAGTCGLGCAQGAPTTAPASGGTLDLNGVTEQLRIGVVVPATAATLDPVADQALDLLQKRDASLTDFTAKIRYQVVHTRLGDTETRLGTFDYIKGAADRKFAAQFDKLILDEAKPRPIDQKFVFDGQWLIIRNVQAMMFIKEQLAPPGKPFDPFKLGQGPFPIPIGQDKKDILHDFTVTVVPPNATAGADPPPDPKPDPSMPGAQVHLKLVPREAKAFNFTQADIWVNKEAELPVQVSLVGKDGNITTIELTDVKPNKGAAVIPDLPAPPAGGAWRIEVKPYGGGGPAAPAPTAPK